MVCCRMKARSTNGSWALLNDEDEPPVLSPLELVVGELKDDGVLPDESPLDERVVGALNDEGEPPVLSPLELVVGELKDDGVVLGVSPPGERVVGVLNDEGEPPA